MIPDSEDANMNNNLCLHSLMGESCVEISNYCRSGKIKDCTQLLKGQRRPQLWLMGSNIAV